LTAQLTRIEEVTAEVFIGEGGLAPVIAMIEGEIAAFKPDISTVGGRKEIASMAYKVATSKTFLDNLGKDFVASRKAEIKEIDDRRKEWRDYMDAKKNDVRAPLTEWETREAKRVQEIQARIAKIKVASEILVSDKITRDKLVERLGALVEIDPSVGFDEFAKEAAELLAKAKETVSQAIATKDKEAQVEAELESLRKEMAERAEADKQEALRLDLVRKAEAQAKADEAEAKRKAEAEAQAIKDAELRRIQAEKDAEIAKLKAEAVAVARQKEAESQKALQEAKEAERREANKAHRSAVMNKAYKAFVAVGLDKEIARGVVAAIVDGKIPGVTISF
jgi:hypothetical protein